jgi:argininosuccinate synthase
MDKIYISRISEGFTGKGNTTVRLSMSTNTSKQTITMSVLDMEILRSEIDLYLKKAWS